MYNFGKLVLNITMVIASVWIVGRFWGTFFEKRKYSIFSLLIWFIFCYFQFFRNKGEIETGITMINIGLIFLISIVCYSYAGKEKLFLLLVFYALWSLIELSVFFFISSFIIKKDYIDEISIVISNSLMVLLVHIISNIWGKKEFRFVPIQYYCALLLIPAGSIFIAANEFSNKEHTFISMLKMSILFMFNVIISELYIKISDFF